MSNIATAEFDVKKYNEAKMFAIRMHGVQDYDGFPYQKHLQDVEDVLEKFGYGGYFKIAAWLHDIMEDCSVSYNDVKKSFGENIAEIVYCVTDELGRNRKERKEKTYPKIKSNPDAIIIKLADRIANIENSFERKHSMLDAYQKEYEDFKNGICVEGHAEHMWAHLALLSKSFKKI